MPRLNAHRFKLKTLDEIPDISFVLAQRFPNPKDVRVGIYELLINAIEHGNLGLGFETKTSLLRQGRWEEEIKRRMALPAYSAREVSVRLVHNDHLCLLGIADQGTGFPWKRQIRDIARGRRPNGRGLLIAMSCDFERLTFNPAGNKVLCAARF